MACEQSIKPQHPWFFFSEEPDKGLWSAAFPLKVNSCVLSEFEKHSSKILEVKHTITITILREKPSHQYIQSLKHLDNEIIEEHKSNLQFGCDEKDQCNKHTLCQFFCLSHHSQSKVKKCRARKWTAQSIKEVFKVFGNFLAKNEVWGNSYEDHEHNWVLQNSEEC